MSPANKNPSSLRQTRCRAAATKLLESLWVQAPDEIDVETLAYKAGNLRIEEGGLENCEGRIVASSTGGTIRIKKGLNPGRRRFTAAHEIGHFLLHPRAGMEFQDTASNFTLWNDAGEEAEANMFAAELLMPESLFRPRAEKLAPSLALVDKLAAEFTTSFLATAYQYVNYTLEQVALVVSIGGKIKSFSRSAEFWPMIRQGQLHRDSGAVEISAGKSSDTKKMVVSPAYAWLTNFSENSDRDIKEDSRYLDWYNCIVTMLWLEDDLDD